MLGSPVLSEGLQKAPPLVTVGSCSRPVRQNEREEHPFWKNQWADDTAQGTAYMETIQEKQQQENQSASEKQES